MIQQRALDLYPVYHLQMLFWKTTDSTNLEMLNLQKDVLGESDAPFGFRMIGETEGRWQTIKVSSFWRIKMYYGCFDLHRVNNFTGQEDIVLK